MVSLRSLSIVAALAATVAATPASAFDQFGGICGRRECTLGPDPPRERTPRTPRAPSPAERQATSTTHSGIAAFRAGNYRLALDYFRRALAMFPRERAYRYNVALALQFIAFDEYDAALAARDYSRLDAILQRVDEADRLGGGARANSRNLRRAIAATRRELATRAEAARRQERRLAAAREAEERQQLGSRTRIANMVADHAREERSRPPGRASANSLAFGDPDVVESNDAVRTGRDRDERNGQSRSRGPAAASGSRQRLEDLARNRVTRCDGFDGGSCIDLPTEPVRIDELGNISGQSVISEAQLARYNRVPAFQRAAAVLRDARAASERASQLKRSLEQQRDRAPDTQEQLRIQVQIIEADREADRAYAARVLAEQEVTTVITRIEQRDPIILGEEAPLPPDVVPRQPPPRREQPRRRSPGS